MLIQIKFVLYHDAMHYSLHSSLITLEQNVTFILQLINLLYLKPRCYISIAYIKK